MRSEDRPDQLRALHRRVLTRARTQAYPGLPSKELGRILDDAEYLMDLLLRGEEDTGEEFRRFLERIEQRHAGSEGLAASYDARPETSGAVAERRKAAIK